MITPRARAAMLFIQRYMAESGQAPNVREMAAALGLKSISATHRVIVDLQQQGYIDRSGFGRRPWVVLRAVADDRFEEAARAVCTALGHDKPGDVAKARAAIVSTLVERNAA